ncbi:hypothetical protein [Adhaeribacter rhizoryzae]|uniref:Uncharacterized protein n=1 Tax=Adhaeribacter rhizoryzae TaxID=2607907 RepID=A0A5M6DPV6_9BACT|nr:hypothetical protein [Adhaeribacter rhizoryzae]KAA5549503.1 hypothetical protein F0145_02645 [Adhaeribacter rhizoryzae]
MEKLEIYHPDKFYPNRTFIIYSAVVLLLFLSFILQELGFDHNTVIFDTVVYLALFCFISGNILKLISIGKCKPLYGKLNGEIIFEKGSIKIQGEIIPIDEVQKIEFEGTDWLGLYEQNRFSFENGLSNGTKNWLIVYLNDSSQRRIRFQKYEACQLIRFKEVLLDYYANGKIIPILN